MNRRLKWTVHCSLAAAVTFTLCSRIRAQEHSSEAADTPVTMLGEHFEGPVWLSGQINLIGQRHGGFPALYSGPHSFRDDAENALSRVLTLYTGLRLSDGWEVYMDIESAGGDGLSDAFGLAGYTNLDVVRNPTLGSAPY